MARRRGRSLSSILCREFSTCATKIIIRGGRELRKSPSNPRGDHQLPKGSELAWAILIGTLICIIVGSCVTKH